MLDEEVRCIMLTFTPFQTYKGHEVKVCHLEHNNNLYMCVMDPEHPEKVTMRTIWQDMKIEINKHLEAKQ